MAFSWVKGLHSRAPATGHGRPLCGRGSCRVGGTVIHAAFSNGSAICNGGDVCSAARNNGDETAETKRRSLPDSGAGTFALGAPLTAWFEQHREVPHDTRSPAARPRFLDACVPHRPRRW